MTIPLAAFRVLNIQTVAAVLGFQEMIPLRIFEQLNENRLNFLIINVAGMGGDLVIHMSCGRSARRTGRIGEQGIKGVVWHLLEGFQGVLSDQVIGHLRRPSLTRLHAH